MPFVRARDIDIAYEASGDPAHPAILLIMGLGMQLTAWPPELVEGLVEQGFYVVRFDNRDVGLSSKMTAAGHPNLLWNALKYKLGWTIQAPYTLADMADDALAVMNGLRLKQAHIVGASMGGMIAQTLAARHPQRVLSLVSIMSSSGRRSLPGPSAAAQRALFSRPARPHDIDSVTEHLVGVLRVIGSPAYPIPEGLLRERVRAAVARSNYPAGVLRQMTAVAAAGDRSAELATIGAPTLVIHGAADPLVPLACGVDTAHCIPGARLEVIEGMGHDLPPALIERLLALIATHAHGKMLGDSLPNLFEKQ
ncbi:alpha/beta fold hydrolase [Massilia sp. TS11]|uniref:alpha/beta fold hydrolase n=1 Tax=Massilia sp. TS11 TaxID=2908003 RepID=UPI001EDB7EA9|nr:alpha/beta fold hydrolase [Massilia sp. TS11]MCG2584737.1 alpha/beta fold hydrolase [Massilia sp. TS11]